MDALEVGTAAGTLAAAMAAAWAAVVSSIAVREQRRSAAVPQVVERGGELLSRLARINDALLSSAAGIPAAVADDEWEKAAEAARRLSLAVRNESRADAVDRIAEDLDRMVWEMQEDVSLDGSSLLDVEDMLGQVRRVVRDEVHRPPGWRS